MLCTRDGRKSYGEYEDLHIEIWEDREWKMEMEGRKIGIRR